MAANENTTASAEEASATETLEGQEEALNQRVKRVEKAHEAIKNYTIGAMAVGFVPLPLVDLAALSGIQLKLVHSLANV